MIDKLSKTILGGGLFGSDDESDPYHSSQQNEGGAMDDGFRPQSRQGDLNSVDAAIKKLFASGAEAYGGGNAQQRWTGTPAIGLSMFKPRTPIYSETNFRKVGDSFVPRRKIDASTHMAEPPSGLISGQALINRQNGFDVSGLGSSLTPQAQWDAEFHRPAIPARPTPDSSLPSVNVGTSGAMIGGKVKTLYSGYSDPDNGGYAGYVY